MAAVDLRARVDLNEPMGLAGLAGVAAVWAWSRWLLRGPDLSRFDQPVGERFGQGPPSAGHQAVVASLGAVRAALRQVPRRQHIPALRRYLDEVFPEAAADMRIVPVHADGVPAEWVLSPDAQSGRRLLYLHGGAFATGSPRSHRRLTTALSRLTGAAVLAIDYRLMPEHPRRAGILDCRQAWRWMIDRGPGGPAPAETLWVAGDSAGGNLALSLLAWVRDQGGRQPDGAVVFSPATDATLGSPSLRAHRHTDPMLGPLIGPMLRVPRPVLLWAGWLYTRIRPRHPDVSPVHGDLARLPPVLVQASEHEMLRDDARRYVNRARAAGSPVHLQTWDHMVHVWQIFQAELPEARDALERAAAFLRATLPAHARDAPPPEGAAAPPADLDRA